MPETRRLAAIMFTDLVGSTRAAQRDEKSALARQAEQERILRPLFGIHGGREVKSTGDGFLVEFESALRAVECAVEAQRALLERNSTASSEPLLVRFGIHLGDVERRDGDIFGDAVNIASRIESLAEPGGICLTQAVFEQVHNKVPFRLETVGPKNLKGVRAPVVVYRVQPGWAEAVGSIQERDLPRLAVLPLANISPEPRDEYFADGLTEELIATLSQIKDLRVIARTSVARYKATSKSIAEIGTELRVSSVLEGSVRKAGNQLRITLQLIDTGNEEHRWSKTFDRTLDEVFLVQAEIAEQTAGALKLELLKEDREALRRGTASSAVAYDSYLRGRVAFGRLGPERYSESIRHFEAALEEDPNFALALAGLANVLIAAAGEILPASETLPRARELAARALAIDPGLAEAHVTQGNLALQADLDWGRSEEEFVTAITLNPSSSAARSWYGFLLAHLQRYAEAQEQLDRCLDLDPDFETSWVWTEMIDYLSGDLEGCVRRAKKSMGRFPDSKVPYVFLALAYADLGRADEALRAAELGTGVPGQLEVLRATVFPRVGRAAEARRILELWEKSSESSYVPLGNLAALHASLGQTTEALELLERDFREGERSLWFTYLFPYYDVLRNHPRFQALLTAYRLPLVPPPRASAKRAA